MLLDQPLPALTLAALLLTPVVLAPAAPGPSVPPPSPQDAPGPGVLESDACALCHSNVDTASAMRDADGGWMSPYDLWSGSMMANSTRDPLWRAAVSVEVAAAPAHRVAIESECLRCHAPLAHAVGIDDHGTGSPMHVLECESRQGDLARDGASCTVCHGMLPDGLGTPETFSGHFRLDPARRLFGPHAEPFPGPMLMHTGFTPTRGDHVMESRLCATCHTLETAVHDLEGEPTGATFLEQAPYLEWRNSAFSDEGEAPGTRAASCQDCHLPTSDASGRPLEARIARNPMGFDWPPIGPRAPYGRHLFVGGNTLMLSILRDHAEELGVRAPAGALEAALEATRASLRRAARVELADVRLAGDRLSFAATVENRTGHKLPTGHPTRRAWLRAVVRDAGGAVVFASGATDDAGRILGADGRPLPTEHAGGPVEPHRDVVRSADEVASYRAVPADVDGRPTHVLLRAASWYVDDRLLPAGWRADAPDGPRTAPVGTTDDPDFAAATDRVRYAVALPPGTRGPLTVELDLLYQPLSARWAAELLRWETDATESFRALLETADRTPSVLASARATAGL